MVLELGVFNFQFCMLMLGQRCMWNIPKLFSPNVKYRRFWFCFIVNLKTSIFDRLTLYQRPTEKVFSSYIWVKGHQRKLQQTIGLQRLKFVLQKVLGSCQSTGFATTHKFTHWHPSFFKLRYLRKLNSVEHLL